MNNTTPLGGAPQASTAELLADVRARLVRIEDELRWIVAVLGAAKKPAHERTKASVKK